MPVPDDDAASNKEARGGVTLKLASSFKKLSTSLKKRFGSGKPRRHLSSGTAACSKEDANPSSGAPGDPGGEQMRKFREALSCSSTPRCRPDVVSADVSADVSTGHSTASVASVLISPRSRLGTALSTEDMPPLHRAVASGDPGSVGDLLDAGHDVDELHGKDTALHLAVRTGQPDILKVLLQSNARLDEKDTDGWTPLHHACMLGQAFLVQMLKNAGASLAALTDDGMSAMHCSVNLRTCTSLPRDAKDALASILRDLAAWGADVNAKDFQGWTPLHMAVQSGSLELVKELIALGADISAIDNHGNTPSDYAAVARGLYHQNSSMQRLLESCTRPPGTDDTTTTTTDTTRDIGEGADAAPLVLLSAAAGPTPYEKLQQEADNVKHASAKAAPASASSPAAKHDSGAASSRMRKVPTYM